MTFQVLGDLTSSLIARRHSASLQAHLQRLTQEVGSGKVSDPIASANGNLAPLASVTRSFNLLDAYDSTSANVALKLSYQEAAIESVRGQISELGPTLLLAANAGGAAVESVISSSSDKFSSAISALSIQVAESFLFSGASTSVKPTLDASDIKEMLKTVAIDATTAANYYQDIDDWFNDPSGFDSLVYQGGEASEVAIQISSTSGINTSLTAKEPEIKAALKDLALLSLISDGALSESNEERIELIKTVANSLTTTGDDLISLGAQIGEKQSKVIQAGSQNAAERYSLSEAYNNIIGVDVFETATQLEEVKLQLESLYLVTARTARLTLTEFLR